MEQPGLFGLMMDTPLILASLLERAAKLFSGKEIASRYGESTFRYTYRDFHARVHQLAHALASLGLKRGDRAATLCWNSHRHLELYWAVPCSGIVLHPLNLRLSDDQLAYIINHAEDRVIFADASLVHVLDRLRDQIPSVKRVVVLPDERIAGRPVDFELDYEELLSASPSTAYPWPRLDEREAFGTCYTSGTTGNPKAVWYTHRGVYLHTMMLAQQDTFGISERDAIFQMVPMFHANGWGFPYAAISMGSRLILSGRNLQPADIAATIEKERVTFTFGVPTLWMQLLAYLDGHPTDISSLRCVLAAGSATPRGLIEQFGEKHGLEFRLGWGMSETTPMATVTRFKSQMDELPASERYDRRARHGLPVPGIELRILGEDGAEVPWDGTVMGELQVRGPWVTSGYYNDPRPEQQAASESFQDGWFRTGDVATIDSEGYIQIMDRTKDLVKSGGEWISSVDLENAIMSHPKVMEAAVIAIPHPKWQERPLACVVPRPGETITKEEILEHLNGRVAKWWLPDEVVMIEAVPKTSVGKFNKRALRAQFARG
jgi:fatty-acyl-CoA synthase